jgi:DNA-directed RNA polymerase subunit RPC12/RpoP
VTMKTCREKHTLFQPTNDEWACPSCGADSLDFCVDTSPNMDCELLHTEDYVTCSACDREWTGTGAARLLKAKAQMVKCPTCSGRGFVKKGANDE